jgi:hypothetical protein
LKKRGYEEVVGLSSGIATPTTKKKKVEMPSESKTKEDEIPMECKKRTLPVFPQLPYQFVLLGKDVNGILVSSFIIYVTPTKTQIGVSLVKSLNPQLTSSTLPCTKAAT